jgi:nucleoside-diphosphate-sugar epimerase
MATAGDRPRLFCFGLGYCARVLAGALKADGWDIAGTCRKAEEQAQLAGQGIKVFLFDGARPLEAAALTGTTHLLSSIPPPADGDPVLRHHASGMAAANRLEWAGYLSTTGVYGDTGGAMVDEEAPLNPTSERGARRAEAENGWLALYGNRGVPVHVFRLSNIYGPGRNVFDQVRSGTAKRIDAPERRFARIHVADIAAVLKASIRASRPGAVYNVCDDFPAPPADVVTYACQLLGVDPPPLVPFAKAVKEMLPMARSFWHDDRCVDNSRIKAELGVELRYPDYRAGLRAILAGEKS